jgi:hypothetical protein
MKGRLVPLPLGVATPIVVHLGPGCEIARVERLL